MRDNDPIIGAIFFAIENMLRSVQFRVEPEASGPDGKPTTDDIEAAEFVNSCLADMEQSWPEIISQLLTFLQYGWSCNEVIFKVRKGPGSDPKFASAYDDGMIGWRKFAPRAQETLLRWDFDESGDAIAMIQLLPTGGPLLTVPLARCIHLTTRPLKNNPEGVSLLRNAYTSYFYKKRIIEIEAIGIERDLAGIPIAWVPAKLMASNASVPDQQQLAIWKQIVRDIHQNTQASIVMPLAFDDKGNKLYDLTLLSTGGRRQFDTNPIIDRYDHRIAATFLADFITLGGAGKGQGSYAQSKNKSDMFGVAVIAYLDTITAEFNRKAIPNLLALNSLTGKCRMTHGDVKRTDLEELGAYIQAIAMAGALVPDTGLEAHLRNEAGLPAADGSTSDDLNDGGDADMAGDEDAANTISDDPAQAQGRGGGAAGGQDYTDINPIPARKRRPRAPK